MKMTFWEQVVENVITNAAAIIVALTGFGAMIGGFVMQKRMMDRQNEKIDRNADKSANERTELKDKLDKVADTTNGIVQRNEVMAKALGVAEGLAQAKSSPPPPS